MQDILAHVANRLEELLDLLAEKGFGPVKETYLRSWLHTGQDVSMIPQEFPRQWNPMPSFVSIAMCLDRIVTQT